jgi:RNA polymerase sigma-70 factor (ECF subfamily)
MSTASGDAIAPERALLDAARNGDEDAFRRLVEPYRAELHVHCYRMLGSLHDAEDAYQDTLLRGWRGLSGFREESRLRPWLYRIATNVCLDQLRRRPRRVLPSSSGPPTDPGDDPVELADASVWVEPYPDERLGDPGAYATPEARYEQREALELAFIVALQHLPARQRAVLILRDVLAFSAREVAELLETSAAAVNSILQRARKTVTDHTPEQSQQAALRALGDEGIRDLVERFIDAFETADVDAILALLAEDATFSMPPYVGWWRGRAAIGKSWLMPSGTPPFLRYVPTRANGQLALGTYRFDPRTATYLPIALDVLTVRSDLIVDVTAFRTSGLLSELGLPEELAR